MKSLQNVIKESSRRDAQDVFNKISGLSAELCSILQVELDMFSAGDLDEYFPRDDDRAQVEKNEQIKACEKGIDALQALMTVYEY